MSTTWWAVQSRRNTRGAGPREVGSNRRSTMSGFAGYGPDLAVWLKDAVINTDRAFVCNTWRGWASPMPTTKSILTCEGMRISTDLFVGCPKSPRVAQAITLSKRRTDIPNRRR
jgi:hypothetical protein